MNTNLTRRSFMRNAGAISAAGVAAGTLSSCGNSASPNAHQPTNNPAPPPPVVQSGTWVYEPNLFRLTLNLGNVFLGSCSLTDGAQTFKVRGVFSDAMYWAVLGSDGSTLFLQQWTRKTDLSANGDGIEAVWTTPEGYELTLNADGTTAIAFTGGDCSSYGYLGHTALENNIFKQSVASGDPSPDGFIVWTRAKQNGGGVNVELDIAEDALFNSVVNYTSDVTFPFTTSGGNNGDDDLDDLDGSHDDHIVKAVITGLQANKQYFYRFKTVSSSASDSAGQAFVSKTGRTQTLPGNADAISQLKVALASCSSFPHGYFNAYRQLARHDDLAGILHLGDYTYEYPGEAATAMYEDENGTQGTNDHDYPENAADRVRQYSEDNREETVNLRQYRRRFRNYREDIDLQFIHTRYWFINTWDDHETSNDSYDPDGAGTDGDAENHNDVTGFVEGDWEPRKASAAQAYNEWLPIQDVRTGSNSYNDPRLNRNFQFGQLVNLTILDTRVQGRNFVNVDDASHTYEEAGRGNNISAFRKLMNDDQRDFMLQQLTDAQNNNVQWKLLGQQVMMGHLIGPPLVSPPPSNSSADINWLSVINTDQWDGFDAERETIFDHVEGVNTANPIDNFIVLTGDIHTSWAIELVDDARKRAVPPIGPVSAGGAVGGGLNTVGSAGGLPLPANANPTGVQKRFGVEFVTPSITSPGLDDPQGSLSTALETNNPHIRQVDLENRGYSILEINTTEALCTWYHIDSITDQEDEGVNQAFAYKVADGDKTLTQV